MVHEKAWLAYEPPALLLDGWHCTPTWPRDPKLFATECLCVHWLVSAANRHASDLLMQYRPWTPGKEGRKNYIRTRGLFSMLAGYLESP